MRVGEGEINTIRCSKKTRRDRIKKIFAHTLTENTERSGVETDKGEDTREEER